MQIPACGNVAFFVEINVIRIILRKIFFIVSEEEKRRTNKAFDLQKKKEERRGGGGGDRRRGGLAITACGVKRSGDCCTQNKLV